MADGAQPAARNRHRPFPRNPASDRNKRQSARPRRLRCRRRPFPPGRIRECAECFMRCESANPHLRGYEFLHAICFIGTPCLRGLPFQPRATASRSPPNSTPSAARPRWRPRCACLGLPYDKSALLAHCRVTGEAATCKTSSTPGPNWAFPCGGLGGRNGADADPAQASDRLCRARPLRFGTAPTRAASRTCVRTAARGRAGG